MGNISWVGWNHSQRGWVKLNTDGSFKAYDLTWPEGKEF